jgi:hypothetical protein
MSIVSIVKHQYVLSPTICIQCNSGNALSNAALRLIDMYSTGFIGCNANEWHATGHEGSKSTPRA